MAINRKQALLLAADANVTKNKLLREAVTLHLGRTPSDEAIHALVQERRDPKNPALVWVCWGERAIAVRTDCRGAVKDRLYSLIWYWKTLPKEDN